MSQNSKEDNEIDFSVIDQLPKPLNALDFSLQSLLTEQQQKSSSKNKNTGRTGLQNIDSVVQKRQAIANGSFLRDLEKLEEQISFETNPYDIYDQDSQLTTDYQIHFHNQEISKKINNINSKPQSYQHLILDFGGNTKNLKKKFKIQPYTQYSQYSKPQKKIGHCNNLKTSKSKSTKHILKTNPSQNNLQLKQQTKKTIIKQKSNSLSQKLKKDNSKTSLKGYQDYYGYKVQQKKQTNIYTQYYTPKGIQKSIQVTQTIKVQKNQIKSKSREQSSQYNVKNLSKNKKKIIFTMKK